MIRSRFSRPSTATWMIETARLPTAIVQFGQLGDLPVPADWNGDGDIELGVWRPSTGVWYAAELDGTPVAIPSTPWGQAGDIPLAGNFGGTVGRRSSHLPASARRGRSSSATARAERRPPSMLGRRAFPRRWTGPVTAASSRSCSMRRAVAGASMRAPGSPSAASATSRRVPGDGRRQGQIGPGCRCRAGKTRDRSIRCWCRSSPRRRTTTPEEPVVRRAVARPRADRPAGRPRACGDARRWTAPPTARTWSTRCSSG